MIGDIPYHYLPITKDTNAQQEAQVQQLTPAALPLASSVIPEGFLPLGITLVCFSLSAVAAKERAAISL